ncbi:hypothetical protein OIV83_005858 [Microbotryomycetes sp. JL201]|nr:hypothetical protein OIV83_005858 [Microbotryomycetes sp. JL201]
MKNDADHGKAAGRREAFAELWLRVQSKQAAGLDASRDRAKLGRAITWELGRLESTFQEQVSEQHAEHWHKMEHLLSKSGWTELEISMHKYNVYTKTDSVDFDVGSVPNLQEFHKRDFLTGTSSRSPALWLAFGQTIIPSCLPHQKSLDWRRYHEDLQFAATRWQQEKAFQEREANLRKLLVGIRDAFIHTRPRYKHFDCVRRLDFENLAAAKRLRKYLMTLSQEIDEQAIQGLRSEFFKQVEDVCLQWQMQRRIEGIKAILVAIDGLSNDEAETDMARAFAASIYDEAFMRRAVCVLYPPELSDRPTTLDEYLSNGTFNIHRSTPSTDVPLEDCLPERAIKCARSCLAAAGLDLNTSIDEVKNVNGCWIWQDEPGGVERRRTFGRMTKTMSPSATEAASVLSRVPPDAPQRAQIAQLDRVLAAVERARASVPQLLRSFTTPAATPLDHANIYRQASTEAWTSVRVLGEQVDAAQTIVAETQQSEQQDATGIVVRQKQVNGQDGHGWNTLAALMARAETGNALHQRPTVRMMGDGPTTVQELDEFIQKWHDKHPRVKLQLEGAENDRIATRIKLLLKGTMKAVIMLHHPVASKSDQPRFVLAERVACFGIKEDKPLYLPSQFSAFNQVTKTAMETIERDRLQQHVQGKPHSNLEAILTLLSDPPLPF